MTPTTETAEGTTRTAASDQTAPPPTGGEVKRRRQEAPQAQKLPEGPLKTIHVFWLAGMSCDGCTISTAGATNPSIEDLLNGNLPGLPKVLLHHPVLSMESGDEFMHHYEMAVGGELDAPYVVVYEGSVPDERIAQRMGGYWSAMGVEVMDEGNKPRSTAGWLERMADGAAAVIAIGTCATWGGIPSAAGNPTGAMSVMDFLDEDFRSAYGLPVVNVPGCAPVGDNFTETVAAILLYLQGMGPIPDFDALGRPAWLFEETVHRGCTRAGYYEEGVFAEDYGDKECLVEVGCWGPVVNCNIVERGAINHMGGCMKAGGVCIGCTMPGFPDKFSPFYKTPPGSILSTAGSRTLGSVVRRLRKLSQDELNRETRWDANENVPSGWGHVREPGVCRKIAKFFYKLWQFWGTEEPGRKGRKADEIDWPLDRPGRDEDYPMG